MPPAGLAILLGAGPATGSGIARVLAHPSHGNLAVALLSRSISHDSSVLNNLRTSCPEGVFLPFPTDISSEQSLSEAFSTIKATKEFQDLPLKISIFNVKHSHRTPFLEETRERFENSLTTYVGGAMTFAQESIRWMSDQQQPSSSGNDPESLQKKGTIIFTGTLGALRTNQSYAAYGGTRSSVRMLAQSLAREFSSRGIHVVHAIANGGISDAISSVSESLPPGNQGGNEDVVKIHRGEKMRAESVGFTYLWLMRQDVDLWVHELDMRPAAEKF